jgi:Fic family protein
LKDALVAEKDAQLKDPDRGKKVAIDAFNEAEEWRKREVDVIYKDVSDAELDSATRWMSYAEPFSAERSCAFDMSDAFLNRLDEIAEIISNSKYYEEIVWTESKRRAYSSLHTFHSTGIEGNTLTLSETALVINNQSLFSGFRDDFATPVTQASMKEVRNLHHLLDALQLSSPLAPPPAWRDLSSQALVDMNSAILRGLINSEEEGGFRRHPVGVGHQHVVLPMPDEVPHLINRFLRLINTRLRNIMNGPDIDILGQAVALACDAHTTFVHIHPFPDGNGRLARVISGIVLQAFGLPAPMFIGEEKGLSTSALWAMQL